MKTVWLILPGIRSNPGEMFAWTDRAARFLAIGPGNHTEKLEYKVGMLRSPFKLNRLADNLSSVVKLYNDAGVLPSFIAHSNGNVLISKMLKNSVGLKINEWHMLFPACSSDCGDNGINIATSKNVVRKVVCYGSKNDKVVKWGSRLTSWLNFVGLGYGNASFKGLTRIADNGKVSNVRLNAWGHSEFAKPGLLVPFIQNYILHENVIIHKE